MAYYYIDADHSLLGTLSCVNLTRKIRSQSCLTIIGMHLSLQGISQLLQALVLRHGRIEVERYLQVFLIRSTQTKPGLGGQSFVVKFAFLIPCTEYSQIHYTF